MFSIFNNKRLFHPDTVRYITQLANGRPSFIHQKRIDQLVLGLKQDNNWALFDRLWFFAQPVQPLSRVSLVNPGSTQITEVNAPTWTANRGYTGNGATMYLNTNYNAFTQGVNYVQNSAGMGVYSRSDVTELRVDIGIWDIGGSGVISRVLLRNPAGAMQGSINTTTNNSIAHANPTTGLYSSARTAVNLTTYYRNGVSIGTEANVSSAPDSGNMFVLAMNGNGAPTTFSTKQLSMAYFGGGGIDQLKLFLRAERYLDSLAAGVV